MTKKHSRKTRECLEVLSIIKLLKDKEAEAFHIIKKEIMSLHSKKGE